ncbi:MAG: serine hydrolase [Bacteroidota bacterium]
MKHSKFLFQILIICQLSSYSYGQGIHSRTNSTEEKLSYFLKLADSIRVAAKLPGVGIAIVYDQEIIHTGGLGYRNLERKLPVDANTLFSIGSNTKGFTGVLAAQLVDQGLMDWYEPLISYLPELKLKDAHITENVNMADALRHGTGLGSHDEVWKFKSLSREELLAQMHDLDFVGRFRTSYIYNNLMYTVVGMAQEKASGKSWESLIETEILEPLEMSDSYTHFEEFMASDQRAIGYREDGLTEEISVDITSVAPAGAISSTPKDIAKWLLMLLNEGKHKGKEFMSKAAHDYVMMPGQNVGFRAPNEFWYYNAGIGGYYKEGKRSLGHNGGIEGQNSRMVLKPDEGFGIFIMTNQISGYKELMTEYAEKIFLQNDYRRNPLAEQALQNNQSFAHFQIILDLEGVDAARDFYMGMNKEGLEASMNALAYVFMGNGEMEKAAFLFEQNILTYPNSANAFDSYGEYFFVLKNYEDALTNYEKSLELDPKNTNADMMIQKIKDLRP